MGRSFPIGRRLTMKIRRLKENDLEKLIELYSHYTIPESLPPLSHSKIYKIWNQIESSPFVNYFVLETKGEIVTSCILSMTPAFIRGGNAYGLIEHVVTHREHRRKGYANAILRFALKYAWKKGCTEVMLLSGWNNKIAHRLYESIGFDRSRRKGFIIFKPRND
jgi:predicted GNAT family acetyltransferase